MVTKTCEKPDETALIAAFPEADVILLEGFKHSDYPKVVCRWPEELLPDAAALADEIERLR